MPDWRPLLRRRLSPLRLAPVREAEVIEEITQHLQQRDDELRSAGAAPEEAARDAAFQLEHLARQLAGVERRAPAHAVIAAPRGRTMFQTVWQDVKYAVRTFAAHPGFSAVILLTLALGIGATTAVFSVLDVVLLRPLPYPDIDRIVMVTQRTTAGQGMSVAWPDFQDWHAQQRVFEHLGVFRSTTFNLTGGDQPERLSGAAVSSELFAVMGIEPLAGRWFGAAEDGPGADHVVIVSERLWRSHFNSDTGLVGRAISLDGQPHAVVGVMPAAMRYPSRLTDVWVPIGLSVAGFPPRGAHPGLTAVGKLEPGVTLTMAIADMDAISLRLEQQYPDSNRNTRAALNLYSEQVVRNVRPVLLVLIGAVAFVLLIGCANVANLMLSRAESRRREIAIRASLGAERSRIIQQLLTESLLLSTAGGALGAILGWWAVRSFVASKPSTVPRIDLIGVDGRVLLFVAAISIVTGVVFGLAPALRASAPDLVGTFKESGRGTTVTSRRTRSALVVLEVALTMMLLVGAGLTIRSFARLMSIDPGFNPEHVITARVTLPAAKYPDTTRWTAFYRTLVQRIAESPGVEAAGLNSAVPLEGGGSESMVLAEGDPMPTADRPGTTALFQTTTPGYFRAMGIQILRGRTFAATDTATAPLVAIVDETLVQKLFPGTDPIGKRIAFERRGHSAADPQPVWREVVGVVRHVHHYGLASEPPFVQLYTSIEQLPIYNQPRGPSMALAVRTALRPEAFAAVVRRELATLDPDIPLYGVQTMDDYLSQDMEQRRLGALLLGGFGGVALALAIVGIYGVLSYTVSQRTQEMGIRMALGATRRRVLTLVVSQGVWLTAAGIAIGSGASYGLTQLMRAMLFEISPHDPATFVGLAGVVALAALGATMIPALRATRVNPVEALRRE